MGKNMDKVFLPISTVMFMRVNFTMEIWREVEDLHLPMVMCMRVNGRMIKAMEEEHTV